MKIKESTPIQKLEIPSLLASIYSGNSLLDYSEVGDWVNDYENTLKTEWRVHPEVEDDYNKQKLKCVELTKQNIMTDEVFASAIKETASMIVSKVPRKWELSKDLRKIDTILLNVWRKSKDFSIDEFKVEVKDFLKPYEGKYIKIIFVIYKN